MLFILGKFFDLIEYDVFLEKDMFYNRLNTI